MTASAATTAPAPPAEPAETTAPVTTNPPEPLESQVVTPTADGLKEAVAERSEAVGGVVETLDAWALSIGDMRVSLWDAIVLLMVIGTIIAAAWFISKLTRAGLHRMSGLDPSQKVLADKMVTLAVWALAILIGIDVLGIDLTALAVFSGAFGLAIGFGLQKTFGNLIAGIILLLDKSIKPGDVIAVSDQAGNSTFGEIRKIGIRAVSITTRDQKEYLIPNENLMINQVENWSYSSKNVRMQVPVGIGYNCDIKLAEKLMLEAAKASKRVLASPPPTVWLDQYGENSVDFVIHCWITDPEAGIGNIRSEVLKRLWDLFHEHGIEIPFPQRDINLRSNAQFEQLIAAIAQRLDTPVEKRPDSKQS
ncbi:MAG: mechanosensitive ion channel family protein [Sphingomonadaceae bacterium]